MKSLCVNVVNTFRDYSLIACGVSDLHPLNSIFILGMRKKSERVEVPASEVECETGMFMVATYWLRNP